MGEHTKQERSSTHRFLHFPSAVAGRVGLLQVGERQEELQNSVKFLPNQQTGKLQETGHNSEKFWKVHWGRMNLANGKVSASEESCGLGWINRLTSTQALNCCNKVKYMGMHKQESAPGHVEQSFYFTQHRKASALVLKQALSTTLED